MTNDSSDRIVAGVRAWIAQAPPGAKLPSTRELAAQYGAGPVTVQKALRVLNSQGVVESRPGVGTFVRAVRVARPNDHGWQTAALGSSHVRPRQLSTALRTAPNDVLALHSGYPDRALLPERLVRAAFARASRSDAVVTRPPAAGTPELQAWFANELGSVTRVGVTPPAPSDVIVVPGSQSGLAAAFRSVVGAGRPLVMESPTYWGAILAAEQAGAHVVPIPSGVHGPDPEDVARALSRTGARAVYAQPNFANPTGGRWSSEVADQVLATVRQYGAFLIEDDWAHDFAIASGPSPVAACDDGHVVYLRSLTKSVSPAVRIAGIIARGPVRDRILTGVQVESMYVSGPLQAAALDVVSQPAWRTHVRSLRRQLVARRDLLMDAVRDHIPEAHIEAAPQGGLNLWVRFPDATDVSRLVRDCEDGGVVVAPGDEWFPAEPTGPYLRLNYAGPNPGAFPDAARVIGQALARQRAAR